MTDQASRWETSSTCYKDCASTLGVWNDPPRLAVPPGGPTALAVGAGRVQLLDDASIAALQTRFREWQGLSVACLFDEASDPEFYRKGEYLLPRYLHQAGIRSQRIYPSTESGFLDETRAFFWPVALTDVDVILWVKSEGEPALAMRPWAVRHVLRAFLDRGGQLFLGGTARTYWPYLLPGAEIAEAWLGIQHLALYGDSLLRGGMADDGARLSLATADRQPLLPARWEMEHHPHGYATCASYAQGMVLETRVSFAEHDVVALEWQLANQSRSAHQVRLSVAGDFTLVGQPAVTGQSEAAGVRFDLSARTGIPADLLITGTLGPGTLDGQRYRCDSTLLELPPDGVIHGDLTLSLRFAPDQSARPEPERRAFACWERAERRWQKLLAPATAGLPATGHRLAQRALTTVVHNTWRSPAALIAGHFRDRRIVEVQRSFYPLWAPFEAGFYAAGLRNVDPALARDQVAVFTSLQHADGWIPLVVGHRYEMQFEGLSQAPTLAYGTWQTYQADPDPAFLREVYPGLCRTIEWWFAHRQPRGDGVFGFAHAQEGAGDDHPRADLPSGALRSGMRHYLSPDACGFILMELHCLQRMAEVLAQPADAARWSARIAALSRRTREVCYSAEDSMFWDVHLGTGEFHRVVSPWNFIPLWAGIALEDGPARTMISRYLIGQLLAPIPFPIVAPQDAAYLPDVYWRGPSWPQLWNPMLQVLWWYGFPQEADTAADQLLALCAESPYLMEIYESRTGRGISLPEYSFVATALFEILRRRYRDDPPWRVRG